MMKRKNNKYTLLLVLLLAVTIGYAVVSTQLQINGTFNVSKTVWDIHWENAEVISGSVSDVLPDITEDQGDKPNTKVSWSVTLNLPGDYYEFTVDAVNDGNIDAMISSISSKVNGTDIDAVPSPLPEYIKYSVTYDNGSPIRNNEILPVHQNDSDIRRYNVRVEYDAEKATRDTINSIPTGGVTYNFEFGITYTLSDDTVITTYAPGCPGPRCVYTNYTTPKEKGDLLTSYTKHYDSILEQAYLGHILSHEGKIEEVFTCADSTENGIICITDSYAEFSPSPSEILLDKFGEYDETTNPYGCKISGRWMGCGEYQISVKDPVYDIQSNVIVRYNGGDVDKIICYVSYGGKYRCGTISSDEQLEPIE